MADTMQQATAPGLEAKAQLLFEIPYAELTKHLQKIVRAQVMKDVAEDLLYYLKRMVQDLPSNRNWLDPLIEAGAKDAIERAEGKLP